MSSSALRCRRPGPMPTCRPARASASALIRNGRSVFRLPMPVPETPAAALGYRRLMLGLLVAPALLWLVALIILPHLDLPLLSFREPLAPPKSLPSLPHSPPFFAQPPS